MICETHKLSKQITSDKRMRVVMITWVNWHMWYKVKWKRTNLH